MISANEIYVTGTKKAKNIGLKKKKQSLRINEF